MRILILLLALASVACVDRLNHPTTGDYCKPIPIVRYDTLSGRTDTTWAFRAGCSGPINPPARP